MKRNKFKTQTHLQVQCKKSETNEKKQKKLQVIFQICVYVLIM